MQRPIKTYSHISTHFADSPDPGVFGKHAGIDYAAAIGTPIYAPVSGKVTASYKGSTGHLIEVTADGKSHRMLHMSSRAVATGDLVKEGQAIGKSGTGGTGPHLHWDVRKSGTAWNHSFNDYYDPERLLAQSNEKEEDMLTQAGADVLYRFLLGKPTTEYGKKHRIGKQTFDQAFKEILASDDYKAYVAKIKAERAVPINNLPHALREAL